MRVPRCAHPWLVQEARKLVDAGAHTPDTVHYTWIEKWGVALYWRHSATFSALAYRGAGPIDPAVKTQLLDAFSRSSKRRFVTQLGETSLSGVCFFGGVPVDIPLPTPAYKRIH